MDGFAPSCSSPRPGSGPNAATRSPDAHSNVPYRVSSAGPIGGKSNAAPVVTPWSTYRSRLTPSGELGCEVGRAVETLSRPPAHRRRRTLLRQALGRQTAWCCRVPVTLPAPTGGRLGALPPTRSTEEPPRRAATRCRCLTKGLVCLSRASRRRRGGLENGAETPRPR